MSFDDFVRVGNVGTLLICTVTRIVGGVETAVDVSSTTLIQIEIQKPSGERLTPVTATFMSNGIDGKIKFTDIVGIFDVAGRWKIRGIATTGAVKLQGSWFGFPVDE